MFISAGNIINSDAMSRGIFFGKKQRRAEERERPAWLFIRLLVLSEERGPHAGAPAGMSGSTAITTRSGPGTSSAPTEVLLNLCVIDPRSELAPLGNEVERDHWSGSTFTLTNNFQRASWIAPDLKQLGSSNTVS